MRLIEPLLAEMDYEAKTTRRVLEAIPAAKLLGWKPHDKSFSLGDLAMHIATVPGIVAQELREDAFELIGPRLKEYSTREEILAAFESSLAQAHEILGPKDDAWINSPWTLTKGGKPVYKTTRLRFIRGVLLNHSYHHRGQLSVYLRLLNVPVPSIYGPSADVNPFE